MFPHEAVRRRRADRGLTIEQIIDKYTVRGTPNECWRWTGKHSDYGYAQMSHDKRTINVCRAILERRQGGPMFGLIQSRHTCDHAWCVNPRHIQFGTKLENMRDRFRHPNGYRSGKRTLTDEQVAEIVAAKVNSANISKLAARMGCSVRTIYYIRATCKPTGVPA